MFYLVYTATIYQNRVLSLLEKIAGDLSELKAQMSSKHDQNEIASAGVASNKRSRGESTGPAADDPPALSSSTDSVIVALQDQQKLHSQQIQTLLVQMEMQMYPQVQAQQQLQMQMQMQPPPMQMQMQPPMQMQMQQPQMQTQLMCPPPSQIQRPQMLPQQSSTFSSYLGGFNPHNKK
jgi:hypothetical protein